jgi:competence protein ComEC
MLFFEHEVSLYHLSLCTLGLFAILLTAGVLFRRYAFRWLFGAFLFAGLFIGGTWLSYHHLSQVRTTFPSSKDIYRVIITDTPQPKARSVQMKVDVCSMLVNGGPQPVQAHSILYFPLRQTAVAQLKKGDILLVDCSLNIPPDYGNPDAFDYARYLRRKGVGITGYVNESRWRLIGHTDDRSFGGRALQCREKILALYRSFHWDKDVLGVVSALTIGYKDELTPDLKELYSVAGASHILALSGLHIGFLYVLLLFLLRPLGRRRSMSLLRGFLIILLLWAFAFFTGLSPSVVRSVTMFSLFAVAESLQRDNFSINTLAAAAFFMLLISPGWLFDVGFQLSFCAVGSIICFNPYLSKLYHPRTWLGKKTWQLVSVSVSAQAGTAPFVAYYFSRLPVHFILSSLAVIPLASLIMYTAVLLLLCTPFTGLQLWVAALLQTLMRLLNHFLGWVVALPHASIDNLYVRPIEILLIYIVLIIFLYFLSSQKPRRICAALTGVILLLGLHTFLHYADRAHDSIEIYNVRNCPALHCITADGRSWLVCANRQADTDDMHKKMSRHWDHLLLRAPLVVSDSCLQDDIQLRNSILSFGGKRIGIISDNRWRYQQAHRPLHIDYLYICRGYSGHIEELFSMFTTRRVILDSSLSAWRQQHYAAACKSCRVPYTSINDGSYRIEL